MTQSLDLQRRQGTAGNDRAQLLSRRLPYDAESLRPLVAAFPDLRDDEIYDGIICAIQGYGRASDYLRALRRAHREVENDG